MHNEGGKGQEGMGLKVKEMPNGRVNDKSSPNGYKDDYERVWHLKRNLYIRLLQEGYNLSEHIMDEFDLWQFKK